MLIIIMRTLKNLAMIVLLGSASLATSQEAQDRHFLYTTNQEGRVTLYPDKNMLYLAAYNHNQDARAKELLIQEILLMKEEGFYYNPRIGFKRKGDTPVSPQFEARLKRIEKQTTSYLDEMLQKNGSYPVENAEQLLILLKQRPK